MNCRRLGFTHRVSIALLASCALLAACGEERAVAGPDARTPEPSVADARAQELPALLNKLRSSVQEFCAITDACYPELVEDEEFCSHPSQGGTSGHQRDWPEKHVDACWMALFQSDREATVGALTCLTEAEDSFARCLLGCPEGNKADACEALADTREDSCVETLTDAVGEAALEELERCDKSMAPPEEDDELDPV